MRKDQLIYEAYRRGEIQPVKPYEPTKEEIEYLEQRRITSYYDLPDK